MNLPSTNTLEDRSVEGYRIRLERPSYQRICLAYSIQTSDALTNPALCAEAVKHLGRLVILRFQPVALVAYDQADRRHTSLDRITGMSRSHQNLS